MAIELGTSASEMDTEIEPVCDTSDLFQNIHDAFSLSSENEDQISTLLQETKSRGRINDIFSRRKRIAKVHQRVAPLIDRARPETITSYSPAIHGFIHPQSEIRPRFGTKGFYLNDEYVYLLFLDILRDELERQSAHSGHPTALPDAIPHAIEGTIEQYFGTPPLEGNAERTTKRDAFYDWDVTRQPFNLRQLRGKNVAKCTEKAALSQNLLAFTGIDSYFVSTEVFKQSEKPSSGGHHYLLIPNESGRFIYDPANPFPVYKEGEFEGVIPATYPISEEQFQEIIKNTLPEEEVEGVEVAVDYLVLEREGNIYSAPTCPPLTYGGQTQYSKKQLFVANLHLEAERIFSNGGYPF